MIHNGSYRLSRAIFSNSEVHYDGRIHRFDPNKPALLSQFFYHPLNMSLQAGLSTRWLSVTLGRPLVRVWFTGCHVPVDPIHRAGARNCPPADETIFQSRRSRPEMITS
jgi:hypothetical protein